MLSLVDAVFSTWCTLTFYQYGREVEGGSGEKRSKKKKRKKSKKKERKGGKYKVPTTIKKY